MRSLLLLILCFMSTYGQYWTEVDIPDDETLTKIYARNRDDIWIGGEEGFLCHSIDGGHEWNEVDIPSGETIRDIFFQSPQIGFLVVSSAGKTKMNMGSINGVPVPMGTSETEPESYIIATRNGGETWDIVYENDDLFLTTIRFSDKKKGFAFGSHGKRVVTNDGGMTWEYQEFSEAKERDYKGFSGNMTMSVNAVHWFNDSSCITVGDDLSMAVTLNSALHWAEIKVKDKYVPSNPTAPFLLAYDKNYDLTGVSFISANKAVIVGEDGFLGRTLNGGKSWAVWQFEEETDFEGIEFPTNTVGWIIGESGIVLQSIDGGHNWIKRNPPTDEDLYTMHFFSDGTGFVGGEDGVLFHNSPTKEDVLNPENIDNVPTHLLELHKSVLSIDSIKQVEKDFEVHQGISITVDRPVDILIADSIIGKFDTVHLQLPIGEYRVELREDGFRSMYYTIEQYSGEYDEIDHTMKSWSLTMIGSGTIGSTHWGYGVGASFAGGILLKNHRFMGVADLGWGGFGDKGVQWGDTSLSYFTEYIGGGVEYAYNGFPPTPTFSLVPRLAVGYWYLKGTADLSIEGEYYDSVDGERDHDRVIHSFLKPGLDLEIGEGKVKFLIGIHGYIGEVIGMPMVRGGVRVRFN